MNRRFLVKVLLLSTIATGIPSLGSANVGKLIKALRTLSKSSGSVAAKNSIKKSAADKGTSLSTESAAAYAARSAAQKVVGSTPYASRNTTALADALSILDSSVSVSFILKEMFQDESDAARVLEGPFDAVTATAIYYLLLQESSRQAQLAMWIDPPLQHFIGSGAGNTYSIRKLQKTYDDGDVATVNVEVFARKPWEDWEFYRIDIYWVSTTAGWLITSMRSF